MLCWLLLATAVNVSAKVIYVDANAPGANNGTTWENAYHHMQNALADANAAPKPVEIRVAQGTYNPDTTSAVPAGTGNRKSAFRLMNGVAIQGAYAGFGRANPDARDVILYETILSGDLDGNDTPVQDPCDLPNAPSRAENSYHVLGGSGTDPNAVLEGFTITGGNANGVASDATCYGGGLYCSGGKPTITSCVFRDNSAGQPGQTGSGGAVNMEEYAMPTFNKCTFRRNYASNTGGAIGAFRSAPTLNHCSFIENRAYGGAAIENSYATGLSPTTVAYCTFWKNTADRYAGAVFNNVSSPTLGNCLLAGNSVLDPNGIAGGLLNYSSQTVLTNCTIVGNRALRRSGAMENLYGYATLVNCIVWDNWRGREDEDFTGQAVVSYSNVQGGWGGQDNIDEDPLFANLGGWDPNGTPDDLTDDFWVAGDYHLKSTVGRWDPNAGRWVQDDVTSPCVDTGYYETSVGSELTPNGWVINMGVYGGTREASMSSCPSGSPADISGDGFVDIVDLMLLASVWLSEGLPLGEDATRDGIVDFNDLAMVGAGWRQPAERSACSNLAFNDGFEVGEWNGLWTEDSQNKWSRSTRRSTDGKYSAEIKGKATDATLTSIPIDLQGMPVATISFFWFIKSNWIDGEYIAFEVSTDGGATWQEKARIRGNVDPEEAWLFVSVKLKGIDQVQLRFKGKVGLSTRNGSVDAVFVIASYH